MRNQMRPIHPGEILREEYLVPLGMTANALAGALGVPANRITMLVREARGITADTALRLARYFGTTPELWLTLQAHYDLRVAERDVGVTIRKEIKPLRVAKGG
jgi:addiction module HigA family antidote